ncbi:Serine/threonine-protein kinase fray2 [Psilocybe cubensis]|uniref:Serine/threonine-protein kinase fray2 n=1 Tax=Psilocybe cubensis TaxID=181762 RepID=A0ACB8HGW4_PSICU|nr:Serine/threonine-protein kinase fray2 [Psilocybe cubensis]KAH9487081.1 Serine/threonine-protein kinase fray2 [Psilocybe cubensis]
MSFADGLPLKSTAQAASVQDAMKTAAQKFIGAVEDEWQLYSDCAKDYTIGAPIGFGASSIVYAATYHPSPKPSPNVPKNKAAKGIPCALKVLDLDSLPPRSLQLLQRETTLMSLSKHPNVLRVRGSWMDGHKLYIALRLMNKGSAADVMRYGWPGGMEEDVVRCILAQALKGLNYLHINGFIHRDVKAANLLIDDDGTVLLGDLGVAADLSEDTSRSSNPASRPYSVTATAALPQARSVSATSNGKRGVLFDGTPPVLQRPTIGKRKSFVGTPCWMAPELIQGKQYDSAADIWSFGITALELTQGRPPRSRESPQRVLLKTIQEDSPTLDREGGVYKYSRAFKEVVDSCLVKDPSKRQHAPDVNNWTLTGFTEDLPPLAQRQERRAAPPVLSASSIASWDFATTLNSPTTSVYRRHALEDLAVSEDGVINDDRISSRHQSRLVSWGTNNEVPVTVNQNEPIAESAFVPSSSPSTSTSSVQSSDLEPSPSSTPPSSSAPSSYTSPSEIEHRLQAASAAENNNSPLTSINEYNREPTLVGLNSVLPKSTSTPQDKVSNNKYSGSPGPNLWNRWKNNTKGSPSRTDLSDGDLTPRKEKEKENTTFLGAFKDLLVLQDTAKT